MYRKISGCPALSIRLLLFALTKSLLLISLTSLLMSSAKPTLKLNEKLQPEFAGKISAVAAIGDIPVPWFTPRSNIADRFVGDSDNSCKLFEGQEAWFHRTIDGAA